MRARSLPVTLAQWSLVVGPVTLGLLENHRLPRYGEPPQGLWQRAMTYGTDESFMGMGLVMVFDLLLLQLAGDALESRYPHPKLADHPQGPELARPWRQTVMWMLHGIAFAIHLALVALAMGTTIGRLPQYVIIAQLMWPVFGTSLLAATVGFPAVGMLRLRALAADVETLVGPADDPAGWRLAGSLYYASSDPRIWIRRRIGFGYTLNLAHRAAWFVILLFVAAMVWMLVELPRILQLLSGLSTLVE